MRTASAKVPTDEVAADTKGATMCIPAAVDLSSRSNDDMLRDGPNRGPNGTDVDHIWLKAVLKLHADDKANARITKDKAAHERTAALRLAALRPRPRHRLSRKQRRVLYHARNGATDTTPVQDITHGKVVTA
jgi:hypothetical protein